MEVPVMPWLSSLDTEPRVQILDKFVCIFQNAKTLLPLVMDKW